MPQLKLVQKSFAGKVLKAKARGDKIEFPSCHTMVGIRYMALLTW